MGTRLPHSRPPRRNSLCPLTKFPIIKTHSTSQKMAPGGPPGGARGRGGKFKKFTRGGTCLHRPAIAYADSPTRWQALLQEPPTPRRRRKRNRREGSQCIII